jgi:hypothetical protein
MRAGQPADNDVPKILQLVRNIVVFVATGLDKPHGMMEKWKVGILDMKSGKRLSEAIPSFIILNFLFDIRYS